MESAMEDTPKVDNFQKFTKNWRRHLQSSVQSLTDLFVALKKKSETRNSYLLYEIRTY